jgi:hypothetical protein
VNYRRGNPEWVRHNQAPPPWTALHQWDDIPVSLSHFADPPCAPTDFMTPHEPVVLIADGRLQEEPVTERASHPQAVLSAAAGVPAPSPAKLLVNAENR